MNLMNRQPLKWIVIALCVVAGAHAQEEKPGKVRVTVLAIGDRPEITLTTTEKGSSYDKPPEGEVPPDQLFVKDDKDDFKMFSLLLNTPGEPILHPGGAVLKLFANKSDAADPAKKPYVDVPLPSENVDMTVFLLRDAKKKNWKGSPNARPFKNDTVSFPMNSLRVINFSATVIRVKIDEAIFDLQSFESKFLAYPPNSLGYAIYQIGGKVKGEPLLIADSAINYYPDTRLNMVIYDSDGKEPGNPIRHVTYFERAIPVPEPARAGR